MAGYMACHHDKVFDHCADPPSFYRMFHRMVRTNAFVADYTAENLFLLVISMLALEAFRSVRFVGQCCRI